METRTSVDWRILAAGAALFAVGLILHLATRSPIVGEPVPATEPSPEALLTEGPTYGGADDCLGCEMRDSNPFLHFSPTGKCAIQNGKAWEKDLR